MISYTYILLYELYMHKSSNMSDFLSSDNDIDLDFLLGEYTEYDTDHSNSEDENSKPSKKQKTSEKTSDQVK